MVVKALLAVSMCQCPPVCVKGPIKAKLGMKQEMHIQPTAYQVVHSILDFFRHVKTVATSL